MSDTPADERVMDFLDEVKQLIATAREWKREHREWKNRIESYILELEQQETENQELNRKIQQLKLEFSEFAGRMETRLKQIKETSQELPVNLDHDSQ